MGLKEGDRLLVKRRGQEIVLVAPADVVDPTAGAFREYTNGKFLTPDQVRKIGAESIVETADIRDE